MVTCPRRYTIVTDITCNKLIITGGHIGNMLKEAVKVRIRSQGSRTAKSDRSIDNRLAGSPGQTHSPERCRFVRLKQTR